ncbi:MAG: IS1380 family transposase [Acidimicrobiia bacterium]|nr:IS1380 family transposase [Acidimicrobiia bacterium]
MASTKVRDRGHDRGRVLVDAAVMIADGGEAISDIAALGQQRGLFGEVASVSTLWRVLDVAGGRVEQIKTARASARRAVWAAGADPGFYVIDIDATLVGSHSNKQGAAGTYKHGFGFHPLMACLDATGEALAGLLRPGNAGSNTATDHITVLDDALDQLPVDPQEVEVIVRADSAGCTKEFLEACRERNVRFCVSHPLSIDVAAAVTTIPDKRWQHSVSSDASELREHAEITEVTEHVDLSNRPERTRMIARREDPHPGAQLTFSDSRGCRLQVLITDLADTDIAYIEALHRGRGRAEQQIRDNKTTGLAKLPSSSFATNSAWLQMSITAHDLLAWTRLLVLDGDLATAEPKRLRWCLQHTPARLTTTGRRRYAKLADDWPWTPHLITAFQRLHNLPLLI